MDVLIESVYRSYALAKGELYVISIRVKRHNAKKADKHSIRNQIRETDRILNPFDMHICNTSLTIKTLINTRTNMTKTYQLGIKVGVAINQQIKWVTLRLKKTLLACERGCTYINRIKQH